MKRFKNVLFVANSPSGNSTALRRAVELATNNQASLTVVGVLPRVPGRTHLANSPVTPAELLDLVVADRHEQLADMAKVADPRDKLSIGVKVLVGKAFLEIIREVLRNDHDLVIKAAEAPWGIRQKLFGSTDRHLMRKCPCPVWIDKPTDHARYRRIFAAVDQDPDDASEDVLNHQILELSTSLAIAESSELHIVHAWSLYAEEFFRSPRFGCSDADVDAMVRKERSARRRWLEGLVSDYAIQDKDAVDYVAPRMHLLKGSARLEIPKLVDEMRADLVIMGTVGRGGVPGFLMGNTSEEILESIDCSVLTVKPPGFESPVSLD